MARQPLKCFGGPNDGAIVQLDADQRAIALSKAEPASTLRKTMMTATTTIRHTTYTLRNVITPDGAIEYLAPENWTDAQARRWVLEP